MENSSGWTEAELGECMDAIIDYRGKTPKKAASGVPLVTAKIIKNGTISPVTEFIAEEDYDSWMRRGIPKPGDVVMTTEAPLGEVAQLDGRKVALAQRVITLRGKQGILDNTFLRYLLTSKHVQSQLDGRASGTTVTGIKQSELRRIKLRFPRVPEQKRIGSFLKTLDRKIELNRQTNQTLESMAQALFKSWFLDFDPVIDKALAAGNDIPAPFADKADARRSLRKSGRHDADTDDQLYTLPQKVLDLFPNCFQFTDDLGWIPYGWRASKLSHVAEINPKVNLKKGERAKYVDMKSLPTEGYIVSNVDEKEYSGGAKFLKDDILVARITPCLENGKTALAEFLDETEPGFGSTEFLVLRPGRLAGRYYLSCLARDDRFRSYCIQSMVGSSGRQRVQIGSLKDYLLPLPSDSLINQCFEDVLEPMFSKMSKSSSQERSLSNIRETVLPQIISGKLSI